MAGRSLGWAGLAALGLVLALAACSDDPAAYGLTGPSQRVPPPRAESAPGGGGSPDTGGGLVIDPTQPGGGTAGRYWRYN